jgi:hypothetical protein
MNKTLCDEEGQQEEEDLTQYYAYNLTMYVSLDLRYIVGATHTVVK